MHEIVSFSKEIDFKNMINKITSISLEHTLMLKEEYNITGDFIVSGTYKMTAASQIDNDFSYKIPVDIEVNDRYDLSNLVIDIDDFTYEVLDEERLKINIDLLLDKLEIKKEPEIEKISAKEDDDEIVNGDDLFMEVPTDKKLEIPIEDQKEENRSCDGDYIESKKEFLNSLNLDEEEKAVTQSTSSDTTQESKQNEISNDEIKNSSNSTVQSDTNIENTNTIKREDEMTPINKNVNTEKNNEKTVVEADQIEDVNNNIKEESGTSLFASFDSSNETYSTYSIYIMRDGDSIDEVMNKYKVSREELNEYNDLNDLRIGTKIIVPNTKNE